MRIRSIKPDFFKDDELAALPPIARLLFIGLWCAADGEGRLEDRPVRIKAEVLPYDECDVDGMLDALHSHDFVTRYTVGSRDYVEVRSFKKHQRISGIEAGKQSEIPAPDHPEAVEKQSRSNGEATEKQSRSSHCPGREGKGRERSTAHSREQEAAFASFWVHYPRKVGKGRALAVWLRMTATARDEAMSAVEGYGEAWRGAAPDRQTYIPHPAKWLTDTRWLDDPEDWKRQASGRQAQPPRTTQAALVGAHPNPKPVRDISTASPEIQDIARRIAMREDTTEAEDDAYADWLNGGAA